MSYEKLVDDLTEWQGESLEKTLRRSDEAVWGANESGTWELFNGSGTEVASGVCAKTPDGFGIVAMIPEADTATLAGNHLLLVYRLDSNDATVKGVIAEYHIVYKKKKA